MYIWSLRMLLFFNNLWRSFDHSQKGSKIREKNWTLNHYLCTCCIIKTLPYILIAFYTEFLIFKNSNYPLIVYLENFKLTIIYEKLMPDQKILHNFFFDWITPKSVESVEEDIISCISYITSLYNVDIISITSNQFINMGAIKKTTINWVL